MNCLFAKLRLVLISLVCWHSTSAVAAESFTIGVTNWPQGAHPLESPNQSEAFFKFLWMTPLVTFDESQGWRCGACKELPSFENRMAAPVAKGKYQLLKTIWRLDKNQRWGDGTPVTASDFVLAWDIIRTIRADDDSQWASLAEIYDVELGGNPRELVVWFGGKTPDFTHLLNFFPVPNHVEGEIWESAQKVPRIYFSRTRMTLPNSSAALFNGPFVIQSISGSEIYLSPNKHRTPAPKLDLVRLVHFDSFGALAWAVRNNIAHLVPEGQLSYDEVIDLQKQVRLNDTKGTYNFRYRESNELQVIGFNIRNPMLSDVRIRRALANATNRKLLVEKVFARTMIFEENWWTAFNPGSKETAWQFDYSRVKTDSLLNEVGWKLPQKLGEQSPRTRDDQTLEIQIDFNESSGVRKRIAEELSQQWQAHGIAIKLLPVEDNQFNQSVLPKAAFRDAVLVSFALPPGSSPRSLLHSKSIPSFENNYEGQNLLGWHDRAADDAIDLWDEAYLDEKKQQEAQIIVQNRIMSMVPFIPLYRRVNGAVADARVEGFNLGTIWGPSSQNAYLWKWSKTTAVNP